MALSLLAPTFSYQKQTVLSDYFAIKYIAVKLYIYSFSVFLLAALQVVNGLMRTIMAAPWPVTGSLHSQWVAAGQVAAPTLGSVSRHACGDLSGAAGWPAWS